MSAAPATLNLLESTTAADREQARALLHEVSPARARRRGAGPHHRRHRTPGRGQVDAAVGAAAGLARERPHGRACSRSILPRAAPAAHCSATARGSTSTPATAACSSARPPPASGSAGSRRRRARRRRRWPPPSTSWSIETVGVGQAETEVAEVADTVAVVVQPGSGDVLQFLKSGIMEIPDVLVVTKADLGQVAMRARRDCPPRCARSEALHRGWRRCPRCPPRRASTSSRRPRRALVAPHRRRRQRAGGPAAARAASRRAHRVRARAWRARPARARRTARRRAVAGRAGPRAGRGGARSGAGRQDIGLMAREGKMSG